MIPANELRIGNWVSNGEKNYTVDANMIYDAANTKTEMFFGIPLTEDVLVACGFKKSDDEFGGWLSPKHIRVQRYTEYQIRIREDSFGFFYQNTLITRVTSLHQLQNLFFALISEELNYQP